MVCNFDAIRLSYGIEVTNLDDPKVKMSKVQNFTKNKIINDKFIEVVDSSFFI